MNLHNKENRWIIYLILFSLVISFIWFYDGLPKATGESGLLFATIAKHFQFTKFAWIDSIIGETAFSFNGAFPLYALFRTFYLLLPGGVIQAIFFGSCIFLGSVGVGMLAKEFFPKIEQKFLFFIGIAYIFNPYSITFIWNRFLYNHTFAYGLIPFLIFLWVRYQKNGGKKLLLSFWAVSFLGSFAFTSIAYFLSFLVAAAFWSLVQLHNNSKVQVLKRTFVLGLTFITSQLFWLLSFYAGNRLSISTSASFFSEQGNLKTTIDLSSFYGGILNKVTQIRADMHFLAYDGIPWAQWYSSTFQYYLSFIPIILILSSIIVLILTKAKYRFYLIILLLASLILINGTSFPMGNLYLLIYKLHPVLQVLRNPYEKVGFLFYMLFFMIWGIGLWQLYTKKSKVIGNFLLAISFVWWFAVSVPIFNGIVFTYKYDIYKDPSRGFRLKVPDYYSNADNYINNTPYQSRGIAFPLPGEGITHKWEYGYDGVESYNGLFTRPFISFDTTSGKLPEIAKALRTASLAEIKRLLPLLNVSHIVVRSDMEEPINSPRSSTYSDEFSKEFQSEEFGNGLLKIYSVPEDLQSPRIFSSSTFSTANQLHFDVNTSLGNTLAVYPQDNLLNPQFKIFYPILTLEERAEWEVITPNSIQAVLPYVRYQRTHIFYPFVRLKESLSQYLNPQDLISIHNNLAYKRLVELGQVLSVDGSSQLKSAIDDYLSALTPLTSEASFQVRENQQSDAMWVQTFRLHLAVLENYLKSANQVEKEFIEKATGTLKETLTQSGYFSIYENKLTDLQDYRVIRAVYTTDQAGDYFLQFDSRNYIDKLGPEIQINNDKYFVRSLFTTQDSKTVIKVHMQNGTNEIRLPLLQTVFDLSVDELDMGSFNDGKSQQNLKLEAPLPSEGEGEITLEFEYRVIKGRGPQVVIQQKNNPSKNIVLRDYQADNYYFDWTQKFISIPFHSDMGAIQFSFNALPSNDCITRNRFDSKCDSPAFKELYDRHSNFLIRNVKATIKVKSTTSLVFPYSQYTDQLSPNVKWEKINPSIYKVKIGEESQRTVLAFLDQYHPGWTLYKSSILSYGQNVAKEWNEYNSTEMLQRNSILDTLIVVGKTFFSDEISADNHLTVAGYANGWVIKDPGDYILIFKPQRLLYVGWLLTALSGVWIGFLYLAARRKTLNHEKRKKNN